MKKTAKRMIEKGMAHHMEQSVRKLAEEDQIYQYDKKAEQELEQRYERLVLPREYRMFFNDYLACIRSADCRYAEISYMAGILDALEMMDLPCSCPKDRFSKGCRAFGRQ